MKKILLPTDFSDNAWNAIQYALQLFKDQKCTFFLLNTYTPLIYDVEYMNVGAAKSGLIDSMKEVSKRGLDKTLKKIENQFKNPNHTFSTISSFNTLIHEIDELQDVKMMDFIVMGTQGATGLAEVLFGTNTVHVLKNAKCPVLIIPENFYFETPKQIAFPTDFTHFYEEELLPLKQIANLYNSKIRIVHVNEKKNLESIQDYNLSMLKVYLEDNPHTFDWMPNDTKKTYEINEFIKEHNINILAIINYKHSFIESIIKEPIVKNIGFHPIVPFLVIPSQN